jgi:hypothetical protein
MVVGMLIDAANALIRAVGAMLAVVFDFLSFSPFRSVSQMIDNNVELHSQIFSFVNWVVPIAEIVYILEAWGVAVGLWYLISILLRWLRAVQ